MGKEKRGSKFSAGGSSSKRTASRIELAKRRKGKSGHASGLEALLSLANAAEIEEEPPLKEKRRSELESEGKGTKRSRPQLQLQRKKCPLKSERNGNTKDTTISGAPHGPGFCAVGCAPTIEKAKHCLRHTAIAYFIYYQQRKSMTQCISPGGKTAAHVSLDPTLEARLLKERTKWMKNTKPNYLQSASIENETSLEAATSSMAYFDHANKGQQEASDGMHRHQAVKLVGERQQYLGSEHQQQPTVGVGYYRYQQLRPSKEATAHGEDERHYQQQPTYERVARPLSSSVDRLHRPVLNNHSLGSHSMPMYMSSPMVYDELSRSNAGTGLPMDLVPSSSSSVTKGNSSSGQLLHRENNLYFSAAKHIMERGNESGSRQLEQHLYPSTKGRGTVGTNIIREHGHLRAENNLSEGDKKAVENTDQLLQYDHR